MARAMLHDALVKTSNLALLLATTLATTSLAACSSSPSDDRAHVEVVRSSLARDTTPVLAPGDLETLAADQADFAIDFYHALRQSPGFEGKDVFVSPHSVSTALAMTYAGAQDQTKAEMKKALHFNLADDRLHRGFDYLDLAFASRGKGATGKDGKPFRLEVANAVWGQKGMPIEAPFLDTLAVSYGAGLNVVDFEREAEQSRLTINGWAEAKTEDRIKELLPDGSLTTDTRMVLVNAVYFNASWSTKFTAEATSPAPFTKLDGSVTQVATMHASITARHTKSAAFEAIELPYEGGETSMLVIAPTKGSFAEYESSLTGGKVLDVLAGLESKAVQLSFPKTKIGGASFDLKAAFETLGMKAAFTPGVANFNGITRTGGLYVDAIFHQTFLDIDEAGTEAAAATAVVVNLESAAQPDLVNMNVDRPYILAIVDRPTRTLIFVGRIVEPKI